MRNSPNSATPTARSPSRSPSPSSSGTSGTSCCRATRAASWRTKVLGHINVAFVLGIGQFVTTFLIAWWYSRHAAAKLDPKAEAIKARLEGDA